MRRIFIVRPESSLISCSDRNLDSLPHNNIERSKTLIITPRKLTIPANMSEVLGNFKIFSV